MPLPLHDVVRVLLIHERDGGWSAQALEVNIGAQGTSLRQVLTNFARVWRDTQDLCRERGIEEPLKALGPAAPIFFEMAKSAEPMPEGLTIPMGIEGASDAHQLLEVRYGRAA